MSSTLIEMGCVRAKGMSTHSFSLIFFFILFFYSYEICVQIIERLGQTVEKLQESLYEMGCVRATGTSFYLFSLIIFLFCSSIATKSECKLSKGCDKRLKCYRSFCMKWAV